MDAEDDYFHVAEIIEFDKKSDPAECRWYFLDHEGTWNVVEFDEMLKYLLEEQDEEKFAGVEESKGNK